MKRWASATIVGPPKRSRTSRNHRTVGKSLRGYISRNKGGSSGFRKLTLLKKRVTSSKLLFSTGELLELKRIFHSQNKSSGERVLVYALSECERNPSIGKTKRCVGSIEDMIDFVVSVLGHNATVRMTENINGSNWNVMIGKVKGINDGEVTKSVSCHESLYPYLLHYCNSVPKVRVYVSDIVDVEVFKVKSLSSH
ncbi:hypothetical protein C3L33_00716, partial [Rhododendron williamsianum]